MTPDISYFVPVSLVETEKYIEVAYGNYVTEKQIGQVKIRILDDSSKVFIAMLYNILFALYL